MDNRPFIVVVEDEATQRRLLVDYLEGQQFRVSGVDRGSALRRVVERELPSLVLLDVGLPTRTASRWPAGCARRARASASARPRASRANLKSQPGCWPSLATRRLPCFGSGHLLHSTKPKPERSKTSATIQRACSTRKVTARCCRNA